MSFPDEEYPFEVYPGKRSFRLREACRGSGLPLCPVFGRRCSARRCHFRDLLERRQDDRLRKRPAGRCGAERDGSVAMTATGGSFTKVVFKLGTEASWRTAGRLSA